MDTVEKIIAIIIVMVALFIAPLISMSSNNDSITQATVYDIASEFVDDVRECGYISQERYLLFISELDNTGILYDVELVHSHLSINPIYETQLSGNGGAPTTTQKVVGTSEVTDCYYTDEILEDIYSTEGIYKLSVGDTISITVKNRDKTIAQRIRQMVFNYVDEGNPIFVQYGGVIRDENY